MLRPTNSLRIVGRSADLARVALSVAQHKLFNAGLDGNQWRAIDLHEGDRVNERALKNMIRAAVAHNLAGLKGKPAAFPKKRKRLTGNTVLGG